MALMKFHGLDIAGGGMSMIKKTWDEYLADKEGFDASDLLIEITDKDDIPGGNVDSVNGQTGAVQLNADNLPFDNTDNELGANIQDAIVNVNNKVEQLVVNIGAILTTSADNEYDLGKAILDYLDNTITKNFVSGFFYGTWNRLYLIQGNFEKYNDNIVYANYTIRHHLYSVDKTGVSSYNIKLVGGNWERASFTATPATITNLTISSSTNLYIHKDFMRFMTVIANDTSSNVSIPTDFTVGDYNYYILATFGTDMENYFSANANNSYIATVYASGITNGTSSFTYYAFYIIKHDNKIYLTYRTANTTTALNIPAGRRYVGLPYEQIADFNTTISKNLKYS